MTPLEAAWEHYGGTLLTHREGRNKARCPLHDDANASAVVNIREQRWSCFAGCGFGDVYELVKLAEGIERFPEAREFADKQFGVDPLSHSESGSKKSSKRRKRTNSWT